MTAAELDDGAMVCTELRGRQILLARCGDALYAADEMCTHEDASLCLGALRQSRVRCPLHGSWFDLATGAVDDEPATEPLRIHHVRVREGMIEVQLCGE